MSPNTYRGTHRYLRTHPRSGVLGQASILNSLGNLATLIDIIGQAVDGNKKHCMRK